MLSQDEWLAPNISAALSLRKGDRPNLSLSNYFNSINQMLPVISVYSYTILSPCGDHVG